MPTKKPKANKGRKLTGKKLQSIKPLDAIDPATGMPAGKRR
jgi:hypothetical protein